MRKDLYHHPNQPLPLYRPRCAWFAAFGACGLWMGDVPDGIGVIARLAVVEAQLLQRFGEDVFARRHLDFLSLSPLFSLEVQCIRGSAIVIPMQA